MSQAEGGGAGAPDYNDIFERLCGPNEDGQIDALEGFVAYGFYKVAKREWAMKIRKDEGRGPTPDELKGYIATWTDSRIEGLFDNAEATLAAYAGDVIEEAEPDIRDRAIPEKVAAALNEFRKGSKITVRSATVSFFMSMFGAACWTVLLVILAVSLKAGGIDLFTVAQKVG